MKLSTAYISHPDCLKHEMGLGHPECPQRLAVIAAQLQAGGLMDQLECHEAPLATFAQLERVHTTDYIESVQQASPASGLFYLDPDTAMNPESLNAALRAAGAVVLATELVLTHLKGSNLFIMIRCGIFPLMSRPLRIEFPGAWYHVMNRGAGYRNIFNNDTYRMIFVDLLSQITKMFQVEIHGACLMDNHYHLLIKTPKGNLQRAMRHLNGVYTQRYNRLENTDGPLFAGAIKQYSLNLMLIY